MSGSEPTVTLRFDLAPLRDDRVHVERVFPASLFPAEDDIFRVTSDVRLVFDAERGEGSVQLVGTVVATIELPCSRCVEPFAWPVDARFDLRYEPFSASPPDDDDRQVSESDVVTLYYEGNAIDLGQLVHEQFYLSLPMKPLCRPDCAGLCPECGANLNLAACQCERRWVDPRLAPLEALLPKKPS